MKRPIYYPISGLRRDHYVVLFPIGSIMLKSGEIIQAAEVPGFRKTVRKGHPTERVAYRVRRADGTTEDLPDHMAPTLFRPAHLHHYHDPLPPPAALIRDVNWRSEHPAPAAPEGRAELLWDGAYSEPGRITEKGAEVRVTSVPRSSPLRTGGQDGRKDSTSASRRRGRSTSRTPSADPFPDSG